MRAKILLVCLFVLFLGASHAAAAPTISSLTPTSGAVGASVTIAGSNFGSTQGTSTVKFNGKTAAVTSWSATSIVATVPSGATTGNVVVTVSNVASNGKTFTVVAAPSISSLSPTSGAAGAAVTITGSNFGSSQGSSTVKFNGTTATITTWAAGSIQVSVPTGATTGNVIVHASGVDSNGKSFTVLPTPTITGYSPASGLIGTTVTINGTNFGTTKGTVTFNGTSSTAATWTATKITVPAPTGATSGPLVIGTSGVNVTAGTFTVLTLSSIAVTPANLTLPLNSPQRFLATATYSDSSHSDITSSVTWSSSSTAIATINSTGTLTALAQGSTTVQATLGSVSGTTTFTVKGRSFIPTGSLNQTRVNHTATLLSNGQVLIIGGFGESPGTNSFSVLNSAEAYNPSAKTFSLIGGLNTARQLHTATLLQNGKVLIVGGQTPIDSFGDLAETASAEIYDPATGLFTATGNLNAARYSHTATLLQNGKVLIAGGFQNFGNNSVATAELYDPTTGTFTNTGALSAGRAGASATLLNDGTVLVAGGLTNTLNGSFVATSEIYNPSAGTFSATANLPTAQFAQSATVLSNGTVLLAGGAAGSISSPTPALHVYIYDPVAKTFSTVANLAIARAGQTATRLSDGTVLLVGGENPSLNLQYDTAEFYNATTQQFTGAGATSTIHSSGSNIGPGGAGHTATLLSDGTVLVVGGNNSNPVAELYQPGQLAPLSLQITPGAANLLTGGTQTFTAIDDQGQTRLDGVWTVSDTTVATLANNSSGQLTATNPGQVTLTANVDGVIAQAQVTVAPHSLQITPAAATMLIGDSRQFTVVDERGKPSAIATWSVDNASLASITSDSAPTLTAAVAGTVNLTATVVGVSTQIPVTISGAASFAPGTVLWTAPPAAGFTPQGIFQAVPTDTGPSLYSVQTSGTGINAQTLVQAFTSDGQQLWQTALPQAYAGTSVPDGFGGMLVVGACDANNGIPMTLVDVGINGTVNWQTQITSATPGVCPPTTPKMAIGQDGAVVLSNVIQVSPAFVILAGNSGATISAPAIPASTFINSMSQSTNCDCFSIVGQPMVDSDGSVHVEYEVRTVQFFAPGGSTTTTSNVYLLNVAPDYTTTSTIQLGSGTFADLFPANVIPDGQGGLLATWSVVDTLNTDTGLTGVAPNPYLAAHISGGAIANTYPLPDATAGVAPPFGPDGLPVAPPMVLGENGTAFASYGTKATSFQLVSGAGNWNWSPSGGLASIITSTSGNGLTIKNSSSGTDTIVRLDVSGSPTIDAWSGPGLDFFMQDHWVGMGIGLGLAEYTAAAPQEAKAPGTRPGGDPQHNGTTDPGLVLVATQDCHKVNQQQTIYARYPTYQLRLPTDQTTAPPKNYTVFEYVPQDESAANCALGGAGHLNPCQYADGSARFPYNTFADEISAGFGSGFDNRQYLLYALPNQRLYGVKQIYRTLPDGTMEAKQQWNQLTAAPHADPLIDGKLDPWLAPWDGNAASCNSAFSTWFPQ